MNKDQEELDHIIQDILDEDDYEPKFPDSSEQRNKLSTKTDERTAFSQKEKKFKETSKIKSQEKKNVGKLITQITRYVTLGAVVMFFITMFMPWISLSGNAVNYGFIRGEETRALMNEEVMAYEIPSLELYELPLITFSGNGLYKFSNVMEEAYVMVTNPRDEAVESIAAKIHSYYMKAMVLIYAFTGIAALILAIFRGTKGITIVRNLAVFNGIIIGLNIMALKIPYFSMFAIHSKEILKQSQTYMTMSMQRDGIAMDQVFYPYVANEASGLYFALFFLGLWLFLSIVLSEVKNREEEIAIENGELDR